MNLSLLLTTVAKKSDARRLATTALQHRVAACIQIISGVESHFIWKDKKSACREFPNKINPLRSDKFICEGALHDRLRHQSK